MQAGSLFNNRRHFNPIPSTRCKCGPFKAALPNARIRDEDFGALIVSLDAKRWDGAGLCFTLMGNVHLQFLEWLMMHHGQEKPVMMQRATLRPSHCCHA